MRKILNKSMKSFIMLIIAFGVLSFFTQNLKAEIGYLPDPEDGVITLTDDVNLSKGRVLGEDLTIDLNGHYLSTASGETLRVTGNLTVMDTSAEHNGYIGNRATGTPYAAISVEGTLTLKSGSIDKCNSQAVFLNGGTFNLEGGVIHAEKSNGIEIYQGTLNMSGGEIRDCFSSSILMNGGTINLCGGKLVSDDQYGSILVNGGTVNLSGNPAFSGSAHNIVLNHLGESYDVYPHITLTDPLTTTVGISVHKRYKNAPVEDLPILVVEGVTDGNASLGNFVCEQEDEGYKFELTQDGQIFLKEGDVITYKANDGSGNSFLQKYDKDPSGTPVSVTLAANPFSRDYYEFVSWNTKADGSGSSYKPQDVLGVTENITLYAIWKPVEYGITYSLNGGILDQENPTSYTVETESFTLNNPHKDGFDFAGWVFDSPQFMTTVTIEKGSHGNRSYMAFWIEKTYTILVDGKVVKKNAGYTEIVNIWPQTIPVPVYYQDMDGNLLTEDSGSFVCAKLKTPDNKLWTDGKSLLESGLDVQEENGQSVLNLTSEWDNALIKLTVFSTDEFEIAYWTAPDGQPAEYEPGSSYQIGDGSLQTAEAYAQTGLIFKGCKRYRSVNSDYILGSANVKEIRCEGAFDQLTSVSLYKLEGTSRTLVKELTDGQEMTLSEGSTILTFDSKYLDTLKTGKYVVVMEYGDGYGESELTVLSRIPDTKDAGGNILRLGALLSLALLSYAALLNKKRTKR